MLKSNSIVHKIAPLSWPSASSPFFISRAAIITSFTYTLYDFALPKSEDQSKTAAAYEKANPEFRNSKK